MITFSDLSILIQWENLEGRISQRSKCITMYLKGKSAYHISNELKVPKRNISNWIAHYEEMGLAGLIDLQRNGRRVKYSKLKAIYGYLNSSELTNKDMLPALLKRIKRSPDVVWKSARMLGTTPQKKLKRDYAVAVSNDWASIGLVGIYIDTHNIALAFQKEMPWLKELSLIGLWLRPNFKNYISPPERSIINLEKILSQNFKSALKKPSKRAESEIWRRWLNELIYAEPKLAESLTFKVYGDMTAENVFKLLRLTHQQNLKVSSFGKIDMPKIGVELNDLDSSISEYFVKGHIQLGKILNGCSIIKNNLQTFAWCRFHY